MAFLHLRSATNALRVSSSRTLQMQRRTFIAATRLQAHQGYGDGKGDPAAENPQKQPPTNKTQESSEHPGPSPPDVGSGLGSTKQTLSDNMKKAAGEQQTPEDASAQSGGSRSKEAAETGSSPTGGEIATDNGGGDALKGPQGDGAPQPKIFNQSVPMPGVKSGLTEEQKAEVEQHNREFDERHDRAQPAADDKVNKDFWKGSSGRDGTETDWNA
ncbi:hypothetical protein F5Y16DRAFT_399954 [Xylariaceae sp. FL0255]|nr:hypothetical protein F5Y16DRAFT_399954 [Xylariaceae sp. FL0255]